ncbi:electron transport complex subunit RsxB, partial [Providencia huaxiensis]
MMSVWIAIGILAVFGLIFGLILDYASLRFKVEADP